MKIALDGGGLCVNKSQMFGNYISSKEIITSLHKIDKNNQYTIYSFCKPNISITAKNHTFKIIQPKRFWNIFRVPLEQFMHKTDWYLALNQAIPLYTSGKVISICHGLSYMLHPKLYPEALETLKNQLYHMVKRSTYIVVTSKKVKKELEKIYPNFKNIKIIPFGIPYDMKYKLKKVQNLPYFNPKKEYLLFVGMDHPIKNISLLLSKFIEYKKRNTNSNLLLYMVGVSSKYTNKTYGIYTFQKISRAQLKQAYFFAKCTVSFSYYESFNFPIVESLSQKCPVIGFASSIIPELKPYVTIVRITDTLEEMLKKIKSNKNHEKFKPNDFSFDTFAEKLLTLFYTHTH